MSLNSAFDPVAVLNAEVLPTVSDCCIESYAVFVLPNIWNGSRGPIKIRRAECEVLVDNNVKTKTDVLVDLMKRFAADAIVLLDQQVNKIGLLAVLCLFDQRDYDRVLIPELKIIVEIDLSESRNEYPE